MRTPVDTVKLYRLADGFTFRVAFVAGEDVPGTTTFTRGGTVETADIVLTCRDCGAPVDGQPACVDCGARHLPCSDCGSTECLCEQDGCGTLHRAYAPIGQRATRVDLKTLSDGRIAYRATCTCCGVGGCWLTDRVAVERHAAKHECAAREAA